MDSGHQVSFASPRPWFLLVVIVTAALAVGGSSGGESKARSTEAPGDVGGLGPQYPQFAQPVRVDDYQIGEPALRIDAQGRVWVFAPFHSLWRSENGGESFTDLSFQTLVGVADFNALGGGDVDLTIDGSGTLYYVHSDGLPLRGATTAVSLTQGQTWLTQKLATPPLTFHDRPWIDTDGQSRLYLYYRVGATMRLSTSPLLPYPVWSPMGVVSEQVRTTTGAPVVDRASGTAYLTYGSGQTVRVRIVEGGALGPDVLVANTGGSVRDAFPAAAVDDVGNVYVTWNERVFVDGTERTRAMYAASSDRGRTWTRPVQLNQAPATAVWPWPTAGGNGRLGVAYYGTADPREPNLVEGDWSLYYSFTPNALAPLPAVEEVRVVDHALKHGPICTRGLACEAGTREFLDYFGTARFPDGRLAIAYNDQTGLEPGDWPWVMFVRQNGGPLLAE